MHLGVVGPQPQRGPVAGGRPVHVAQAAVRRAETVMVVGLPGVEADRPAQKVDRRLVATLLQRQHSQHEQHVRIVGVSGRARAGGSPFPTALAATLDVAGLTSNTSDDSHVDRSRRCLARCQDLPDMTTSYVSPRIAKQWGPTPGRRIWR